MTAINLYAGWKNGAESVVIPSRITAKHPRKTDWHTYKERHLVENLFLKLKNNRRFATRYEKKALYFSRWLSVLPVSLFGFFDGFKTDSRSKDALRWGARICPRQFQR